MTSTCLFDYLMAVSHARHTIFLFPYIGPIGLSKLPSHWQYMSCIFPSSIADTVALTSNMPCEEITNSSSKTRPKHAYATLLTRPSYLAGAILLAYTLSKHSPNTPLIILYTPETLPQSCVDALSTEAKHSNIILRPVGHLKLPKQDDNSQKSKDNSQKGEEKPHGIVAERFIDTWTKLRVFSITDLGLQKLCFLDADMMIFGDPSPLIFDPELGEDELLASHACVCNLDHDAWAPSSWNPSNCAFTAIQNPEEIAPAVSDHPTKGMMNTGTFVFRPTPYISDMVIGAFENASIDHLTQMKFPDQDFLNEVFRGKWRSLHWSCNALKTWRNWHKNFWRDEKVRVLHYIVDKPWARRVQTDGTAGYRGLDGVTHSRWWREFETWEADRDAGQEENSEVEIVKRFVAGKTDKENGELSAIGGATQNYAKRWETSTPAEDKDGVVTK